MNPGLPRKVRLCSDYVHTNSLAFANKGTRCMLCYSILKQEKQSTTTKGCQICRVPLCSSTSVKFKDPKESCEYRWHHTVDLSSLTKVSTNKRGLTGIVKGAVEKAAGTLMNLSTQGRTKRKRRY